MNRAKYLIGIVFLFFVFVAHGQNADTINQSDAAGKKQGFWRKVDAGGTLIYEGQFRNGVPQGEFKYFYNDGKIKAISNIYNDGKSAHTVTCYPNGKVMSDGYYENQKKDSLWKFYDEYGVMVNTEVYSSGLRSGPSITYYEGGEKSEILNYKDDVKHGHWLQFFKDGTPKAEVSFAEGKLHGEARYFQTNGKLKAEGSYRDGVKSGMWKYFTETGQIQRAENYKDGMISSREIFIDVDPIEQK